VIVFFDGNCNLCNGAVRFLLDRDGYGAFRFASLQSSYAEDFFATHGWDAREIDSIIVFDDGEFFIYADAVVRISEKLPGVWRVGTWLRFLPKATRHALYRLVARHRYQLFGRRQSCRIPTPEEAARFLG